MGRPGCRRKAAHGRGSKEALHFGFGHGPRVCPGKHLGELEVGLVVGAFVKMFAFTAPNAENHAKAAVSTKPADGCLIRLALRGDSPALDSAERSAPAMPSAP